MTLETMSPFMDIFRLIIMERKVLSNPRFLAYAVNVCNRLKQTSPSTANRVRLA